MQSQRQPEYYTVLIPKQDPPVSDLDRQIKLLELGDPDFFSGGGGGGSYSNSSSRVASTSSVKLKSAAVQVPEQDRTRLARLLELGNVNLFGSGTSPTADLLARRQR